MVIREIRSTAAHRRVVSSSSSSGEVQIVGETAIPPGATSIGRYGPKTWSRKRLQLVDKPMEEKALSSHLAHKKAKFKFLLSNPTWHRVSLLQSPTLPQILSHRLVQWTFWKLPVNKV